MGTQQLDMEQLLRQALAQIEEQKERAGLEERFAALEARLEERGQELTAARIREVLQQATPEEREAWRDAIDELMEARAPATDDPPSPDDPPAPDPVPDPEPGKTRPGRKQGMAYSWWVDEDGKVYQLDTARVWNEPDEEEQVALPDEAPPELPAEGDGE